MAYKTNVMRILDKMKVEYKSHPDRIVEGSMVMMAGYGIGDTRVLELIEKLKQGREEDKILDLNDADEVLMEQLYLAAKPVFQLKVITSLIMMSILKSAARFTKENTPHRLRKSIRGVR